MKRSASAGSAPSRSDAQALAFARDLAKLNRLRRAYEKLLPAVLDPDAPFAGDVMVRHASVLFTDLRGYSRLTERLAADPRHLLDVINAHLTGVVRAVVRCGGTVEKFVGDGVFATFGARAEMPDHAERALAAALGVLGANENVNRRHAVDWGFRLEMGVGAAAGDVVVGMVGPPERAELGVLGDPVNVAARLVAQAAAGEMLLASNVYQAAAASVRADLLGSRAVYGRVGEIEVCRISFLRPVG